MPASHTTASLLPGSLLRTTQATAGAAHVDVAWRMEMRVVAGAVAGARGRIAGTVKVKGAPDYPVSRRVRLYRDADGALVGETWSDAATGAYAFDGINRSMAYSVLSYDHTHSFRAVVADNLTPEAA